MGRSRLILTSEAVYHVTARSNNKEWFYIPMLEAWQIFEEMLIRIADVYRVEIHSFVLMSNHFHLVLSTPNRNLSSAMRYFMTESSRHIGRTSGRINHVFGGRNRANLLWDARSLAYVYKYVYRNPVSGGICPTVESYPYSTLRKQLHGHCRIPIVKGIGGIWNLVPRPVSALLEWLNRPTPTELENLIGVALRRREFQFPKEKDLEAALVELADSYDVGFEAVDNPEK